MKKLVLSLLTFALAFSTVHAQYNDRGGRQGDQRSNREYGYQQAKKNRNRAGNDANTNYGSNSGYGQQINRLYQELNLTPSQQQRAEQINSQMRYEIQNLRSNNSLSQENKKREMMYIIQRNGSDFRSILNYQQAQKYDAMVSQMQGNRYSNTQANNGYSNPNDRYSSSNLSGSTQSLLSMLGSNSSLLNILGNNLSLGSILGGSGGSSILGGKLSLDTILGLISGFVQSR